MKLKLFQKLFTKNLTRIPLLWVDFDYKKYKSNGAKNSCMVKIHPVIVNDDHVKQTLNDLIDYIRDNYDMDKI